MVKKLTRLSPPQSSGQLPQPIALPQAVTEQVPSWLKQLLTKYGETEGRLVGLEQPPPPPEARIGPPPPTREEESQVSDLLEKMAKTGVEPSPEHYVPTSVEWGDSGSAAYETPSTSLDDVLAGIGVAQPDYGDPAMIRGHLKSHYPMRNKTSRIGWPPNRLHQLLLRQALRRCVAKKMCLTG